jgi:hypothetical protein
MIKDKEAAEVFDHLVSVKVGGWRDDTVLEGSMDQMIWCQS